jgi:hypothetical protein
VPRAVQSGKRLYTPQITALQTLLRLTSTDDRIPPKVKQHVSANIDYLVTVLSNAQSEKTPDQI